jgi:hypothetical protein
VIDVEHPAAGLGPRAGFRRLRLVVALGVIVALAACTSVPADGTAAASGEPAQGAPGNADRARAGSVGGGAGASGGAGVALPDRLGDVKLTVLAYQLPDSLDARGGRELDALLSQLGIDPSEATLHLAVDPRGALAIGRWGLPGRAEDEIRAAWLQATNGTWRETEVDGETMLTGPGPDDSTAWATARDGVFIYVVTQSAATAATAVASTR